MLRNLLAGLGAGGRFLATTGLALGLTHAGAQAQTAPKTNPGLVGQPVSLVYYLDGKPADKATLDQAAKPT